MNLKKMGYVFFALIPVLFVSCTDSNHSISSRDPNTAKYTVSYDGNGSTSGVAPTDSNDYNEGATVTVANAETLVNAGKTFVGWNTAANGSGTSYAVGSTFIMTTDNITLFAKWTTDPTYKVTYDGNTNTGGTAPIDPNNYQAGATVSVASAGTLIKTGKTFAGWNTAANGSGTSYAVGSTFTIVASNVILYAKWNISLGFSEGPDQQIEIPIPPSSMLHVGNPYQGGKVAYIFQAGPPADPNYIEGEQHGLIAAVADNSTDIAWITGGNTQTTANGNTSTAIGQGQENTNAMMAQPGYTGGAAKLCDDYTNTETGTGVYSDWYLPSIDELKILNLNRSAIGNFSQGHGYWSSSEINELDAWQQYFSGPLGTNYKYRTFRVRCVRSF